MKLIYRWLDAEMFMQIYTWRST